METATASVAAAACADPTGACCTGGRAEGLAAETAEALARTWKALGDATRVRLLSLIAAGEGGEACICDLTGPVGLSQGTVSHHMRVLAEAGLVEREQRGRWAYYSVVRPALDAAAASLRAL